MQTTNRLLHFSNVYPLCVDMVTFLNIVHEVPRKFSGQLTGKGSVLNTLSSVLCF